MTHDVSAIAPVAVQGGVDWVVTGNIVRRGARLRIDASLMDLARHHATPITLQGPTNRTFELVEQLATQVAATQRRRR